MLQLIRTVDQTYFIREEGSSKLFSVGSQPLGMILHMDEPEIGKRLTVRYTGTGDEKDWAEITTSPVENVHSS